MFSLWQLSALALGYVLVLFVIAWWGDRPTRQGRPRVNNALIYSLGLGVYCTSWTFYGAVGEAASKGWTYLPIYLGPMLTIFFGGALIYKLVSVGQRQHITSIADFLAARYGKSRRLAVLVTLVAVVGVLPYIALQLKAVTLSFEYLLPESDQTPVNTALVVAILMALFTLLFGTRHIDATEHQNGLMLAVAFESFIKLLAFVAIGLFCLFSVFSGPADLWQQLQSSPALSGQFQTDFFTQSFATALLLSMVAIICLPRQFHAGVVENHELGHLRTSRWLLPLYLLLFAVFVVPIAAAGMVSQPHLLAQADSYMLSLPAEQGNPLLVLLAFIGGLAAATGMVIVSTMALAIMLTNEVLLPTWLQVRLQGRGQLQDISGVLRLLRRLSVVLLLGMAFLFHHLIENMEGLASIGLLSFAAVAQFAPALLGGLYWRHGHRRGALLGLAGGFLVWVYCLLLPAVMPGSWLLHLNQHGLLGLGLLKPHALFAITGLEPLSHGVFWSLLVNLACYVGFSRGAQHSAVDLAQATRFVDMPTDGWREGKGHPTITSAELLEVSQRGLGQQRASALFHDYIQRRDVSTDLQLPAPLHLVRYVERLLSGAMGASTARIVMGSLLSKQQGRRQDVVKMMDEASELIQFNHQLLRTTIETISQGICVVDRELNVVAWNQAYVSLFEYPQGLIRLGRPIAEVYRYNAQRGYYGDGDLEQEVDKRVQLLRQGGAHHFERVLPNGIVVEVRGTPMTGGGFVSTFMDISERKRDEQALRQINENLERMVAERTRRLSELNQRLAKANEGKTRFLAAAGHDLMQPLNAAHLFTSSLRQQLLAGQGQPEQARQLLENIDHSLQAAERIITALLDISKLDTGTMAVRRQPLRLDTLMRPLGEEFSAMAAERGLALHMVVSQAVLDSDENLLRRVLQNLLSNAIRYTEQGRILFGCRRHGGQLSIEVWDTGPGIEPAQQAQIFEEFRRLPQQGGRQVEGLGLGLAIAERICRLLEHPLSVDSWPGRGTVFRVRVPLADEAPPPLLEERDSAEVSVQGRRVFCVDNDRALLASLVAALQGLGCQVHAATDSASAVALAEQVPAPDLLLVDYQLDNEDGFAVLDALDGCWDDVIPATLMTADRRPQIRAQAEEMGLGFLQKPVTEAMLRQALERAVDS